MPITEERRKQLQGYLQSAPPTVEAAPAGQLPPEIAALVQHDPRLQHAVAMQQIKAAYQPSPEQEANRKSIVAQEQERAKQAANIPAAIRSVKVHLDQFQEAFPSSNHSQALQTAIGASKQLGARFGLGVTPAQRAVLKTLPLATIGLVRVSGALGRVTNQELDAATEALNQAGMTDEERVLMSKNLAQQYLSRVEPKDLQRALKENPDLGETLASFGITVPNTASPTLPATETTAPLGDVEAVKARLRSKYAR